MNKITVYLMLLMMGISSSSLFGASTAAYARYSDAVIFVEGGVEFAVYPDGQFDFFFNPRGNGFNVNVVSPNVNISFNSGYNYDPYIQYDDYGAVVQIERVPIYYDYYGRIIRAGNVILDYNHRGLLSRVGGLHLYYNNYGALAHTSGRINALNIRYVARPWHRYYVKPRPSVAIVYHLPYRAHYHPHRLSYNRYKKYYKKHYHAYPSYKKNFYRPGNAVTEYRRGSSRSQDKKVIPTETRTPVRSNQNTSRSVADFRSRSPEPSAVRSTSRSRDNAATPATSVRNRSTTPARAERPVAQSQNVGREKASSSSRINSSASRSRAAATSPGQRSTTRMSNSKATVSQKSADTRSRSSSTRARTSTTRDSGSNVRARGM